jgi:hypothetical protein
MIGVCIVCTNVFSFNPRYVPSVKLEGVNQPICRQCVEDLNLRRSLQGVNKVVISPHAYEDHKDE